MRSPGRPTVARREDRQRFWAAIARGLSSEDAAGAVGVSPAVGTRWFRESGGMPSITMAPPSGRYLSFAEREEIAILRARAHGVRAIARHLGRSPSTISRERRRNAATRGGNLEYRATTGQWHADRKARRPKAAKLARHEPLRRYVQDRLAGTVTAPDGRPVVGPSVRWSGRRHGRRQHRRWAKAWSPEQIARRLPIDFPEDESMRVSHEAIYQALYVRGRGALRRELTACLRTGRALRVPRARTRGCGKNFVTADVRIATLPEQLRRSLTWDQGAEMAQHAQLRIDTGLQVFFCDPHSPWQRGTNENTNGLLRQYFPKGTDLSRHGPDDLAAVAAALNGRPRKTLGWKTPAETLDDLLVSGRAT
jgi:IS30 family transposase